MNAPFKNSRFSRRAILKGGALTVGFALSGLPAKVSAQGLTMAILVSKSKVIIPEGEAVKTLSRK